MFHLVCMLIIPMFQCAIGGRDTTANDIESVYTDLIEIAKNGKVENPYRYLGLRFDRQNFEKILDNDERSERGAK